MLNHDQFTAAMYQLVDEWCDTGSNRSGVQGAHLNPLGLFLNPLGLCLRTSIPFIWRILSAFLPA